MKRIVLLCVVCLALAGCEWMKGPKGDDGKDAIVASNEYTGYPNSNPYRKYITLNYSSRQMVEVYATLGNEMVALPMSTPTFGHYYALNTYSKYVEFYSAGDPAPTIALSYGGYTYGYKIIVRTFNSSSAMQSYQKSQGKLDTSPINTFIYGSSR